MVSGVFAFTNAEGERERRVVGVGDYEVQDVGFYATGGD